MFQYLTDDVVPKANSVSNFLPTPVMTVLLLDKVAQVKHDNDRCSFDPLTPFTLSWSVTLLIILLKQLYDVSS